MGKPLETDSNCETKVCKFAFPEKGFPRQTFGHNSFFFSHRQSTPIEKNCNLGSNELNKIRSFYPFLGYKGDIILRLTLNAGGKLKVSREIKFCIKLWFSWLWKWKLLFEIKCGFLKHTVVDNFILSCKVFRGFNRLKVRLVHNFNPGWLRFFQNQERCN